MLEQAGWSSHRHTASPGAYAELIRVASASGREGSSEGLAAAAGELAHLPAVRRILGDAHVATRRFEEAAALYDDEADLQRLLHLGLDWGRYALVRTLREQIEVPPARWRRFLVDRALPAAPLTGDPRGTVDVDQGILGAIAEDLGEPVRSMTAAAVRRMLVRGSTDAVRLYAYARLSGDRYLIGQVEPAFRALASDPRADLPQRIEARVREAGGRLLDTVAAGDGDDHHPIRPALWRATLGGTEVVLKEHLRIPTDWARIPGTRDEAAALAAASHPHAVRLLDRWTLGRHEVLVLAHAPGEPLSARDAPLPHADALAVGTAVASAVAALHDAGVLHLDLGPSHVLLDGRAPVLVGFGLAQRTSDRSEVTTLLPAPSHVSPELATTWRATAASDTFQLGLLLFSLWTGTHPFGPESSPAEAEAERLAYALPTVHTPPRLDAIEHPELRSLLASALDGRPEARPTAAALRDQLAALDP